MRFDYKAITCEGRTVSGSLEASGPDDLEARLLGMGLEPLGIRPSARRLIAPGRRRLRRELINFCFHLEQLCSSGIAILDGLADLRDSIEAPDFRDVVADLITGIENGRTLSQAMSVRPDIFDGVFTSLVLAGETGGRLPEVLYGLCEALKWEDELAAQHRKILAYPLLVGTIVLAATAFLMLHLVPQLRLFISAAGRPLPFHTRILFQLSDFLAAWWPLLLGLSAAGALALRLALHHNPGVRLHFDRFKLRVPLLGDISRKIALSRFTGVFAMLYAAGIPVLEALRTTCGTLGNRWLEDALESAEQAISQGSGLAAACRDAGIFPALVVRMLRVGETTGELDKALQNVSYFYSRDVREGVARLQTLSEPLLTAVLGILLGWIMVSILGPIYDIVAGFKP